MQSVPSGSSVESGVARGQPGGRQEGRKEGRKRTSTNWKHVCV